MIRSIGDLKKKETARRSRLNNRDMDWELVDKTLDLIEKGVQLTLDQMKGGTKT